MLIHSYHNLGINKNCKNSQVTSPERQCTDLLNGLDSLLEECESESTHTAFSELRDALRTKGLISK